ncbi:putative ribonuclease H superfamily [Plasmopara halstedii]
MICPVAVFVERPSKMTHYDSVGDNVTGEKPTNLKWFCQHGIPGDIVSDRCPRFTVKF